MSDDLIRREDAIKAVEERSFAVRDSYTVKAILRNVPSADKRGEWIDRSDGGRILHPWWESYECNQCGYEGSGAWNFCPNCGADMKQ